MTKVKMLTMAAGPEGTRHVGQIVEVSPEEAEQLIAGRYAEPAVAAPAPEGGQFDLAGFLKQSAKKVIAGLGELDAAQLEAAHGAEQDGDARATVLEAIADELARRSEGDAGATVLEAIADELARRSEGDAGA